MSSFIPEVEKDSSIHHMENDEKSDALEAGPPDVVGQTPQVGQMTSTMIAFTACVSLVAWIANFDAGFSGIVLAMPGFNSAFGTLCHEVPNPVTGAMHKVCRLTASQQSLTSISTIFQALGGGLAGVSGAYLGRRGTILCGCLFAIIGDAGMSATAGSFLHFMVCKSIAAVGIGQLLASGIVYGAECSPASRRGLLMGIYNVGLALGNVSSAAVCAGSASLAPTNYWQWRLPIIVQIPLSLALGIGIYYFPESPRWLMVAGNEEGARASFSRLLQKDPQSHEISVQIKDIAAHIAMEKELSATSSWTDIYRRGDLRRTLVSSLILVGLALTGIQFVVPYAALFLSGVGIKSPFLINVIVALCIFAGTFFGPIILERGGRRFAMLVGYAIMASCMLIFSVVSTALGSSNPVSQKTLVAFLCIWAFVFGGFIGSSVWLASAEQHAIRLRTYGQANTTVVYQIFGFGAQFWTPYMLNKDYGNLGTNVGYFYFGLTVAIIILVFLFVPETALLTLEQIDDHYRSGRPAWKTSIGRNKKIARQEEVQ